MGSVFAGDTNSNNDTQKQAAFAEVTFGMPSGASAAWSNVVLCVNLWAVNVLLWAAQGRWFEA